jgi:hypothetical protein
MSTYEGEHTIFGLMGQANLTQNDVLQFHSRTTLYINNALMSQHIGRKEEELSTKKKVLITKLLRTSLRAVLFLYMKTTHRGSKDYKHSQERKVQKCNPQTAYSFKH